MCNECDHGGAELREVRTNVNTFSCDIKNKFLFDNSYDNYSSCSEHDTIVPDRGVTDVVHRQRSQHVRNLKDLQLADQVFKMGYPNVYGAKVQVDSCWQFDYLQQELQNYHDLEVIEFLKYGWPSNRMPGAPPPIINTVNHASAMNYPTFIDEYLRKELAHGAIMGPFEEIPFSMNRIGVSPLSTRPKRNTNDRRAILDLSFPEHHAVNDFTPKDSYLGMNIELKYPSVDDLAMRIYELGANCYMFKRDIGRCFRWVPWDPFDYSWFGYIWKGMYYFDKVLSMGHKISPYITQRVTSMIKYIHCKVGYFLLNYVDDFLGAEERQAAYSAFHRLGEILEKVGVKENLEKAVGPTTVIEFLGVTFNAVTCTMEVSPERLIEIDALIRKWQSMRFMNRKQLESLVGKLQFVSACVRPGRVLINRMLNEMRGLQRGKKYVIPSELRKDLTWWEIYLKRYNGVSIAWMHQLVTPDEVFTVDASPLGIGCYLPDKAYVRVNVPTCWQRVNIAYLELWSVILGLRAWGDVLSGIRCVILCDNMCVVNILTYGRSKDLFLQAGMREVAFLQAVHRCELKVKYIKSHDNTISDMISRCRNSEQRKKFNKWSRERSLKCVRFQGEIFKFTHNW